MSIERTNRLRIALQKAKAGLSMEEEKKSSNPSRLGRLLGKKRTVDQTTGFIESQPIHERPLFDAISKEVLGDMVEYQPTIEFTSDHPVSRMKNLRERSFNDAIPEGSLGQKIGFSSRGQPLWSSILDEQRDIAYNAPPPNLATPSRGDRLHHSTILRSNSDWPHRMELNQRKTFKQWKVTAENRQATSVCESIVDHLGERHNPHIIIGEGEVGKSHLLHATGQSALRYFDGDVRILRATEILNIDAIPTDWQEGIASTSLLLIDDVHVIAEHEHHAQSIGYLIDHALNMGVHILSTSTSHPSEWNSSRLWELLRHASVSTIHSVSEMSLAMHIKQQTSLLGLLFEDAHTMEVLNHCGSSWRGVEAALSTLKDAHERGQEILNPEDVVSILKGQLIEPSDEQEAEPVSSISLASDILKRATDVVYSDVDVGGIELHTRAFEEDDDDWEPTIVTPEDLNTANDLLELHLKTTLEELTPEAPTVLDTHSQDRHLTHQLGKVEGVDVGRTADVLAGIDASIDEALAERERIVAGDELRLQHLELWMESILQRIETAELDELNDISDEFRQIQHELGLVSEDAMEAFEMEDEEMKIAHLSTIKPTTRLMGEEE